MFCRNCGAQVGNQAAFCTGCGAATGVGNRFCYNCGAQADPAAAVCIKCGVALYGTPPGAFAGGLPTDVGARVGAYLIDCIPVFVLSLVIGWIPIVGAVLMGFILTPYWLLRDMTGGSLGKMALGLKVVRKDGGESGLKERLLRNLPLAAGPVFLIIPLAGIFIAIPISFLAFMTEAVLLLARKERLGDMIAGTTVVKKLPGL